MQGKAGSIGPNRPMYPPVVKVMRPLPCINVIGKPIVVAGDMENDTESRQIVVAAPIHKPKSSGGAGLVETTKKKKG